MPSSGWGPRPHEVIWLVLMHAPRTVPADRQGSVGLLALPLPALRPGLIPKPVPTPTSAKQDQWRVCGR